MSERGREVGEGVVAWTVNGEVSDRGREDLHEFKEAFFSNEVIEGPGTRKEGDMRESSKPTKNCDKI